MKFKLKKRVSGFNILFFWILVVLTFILTSIDMHYVQGADNPETTYNSISIFTENFENDWKVYNFTFQNMVSDLIQYLDRRSRMTIIR